MDRELVINSWFQTFSSFYFFCEEKYGFPLQMLV